VSATGQESLCQAGREVLGGQGNNSGILKACRDNGLGQTEIERYTEKLGYTRLEDAPWDRGRSPVLLPAWCSLFQTPPRAVLVSLERGALRRPFLRQLALIVPAPPSPKLNEVCRRLILLLFRPCTTCCSKSLAAFVTRVTRQDNFFFYV
jgi:hypothetical protein